MESESPRLRLSILAIIVVSLFGALFARLWYLQVMAAPQFQDVAVANRERVIYEEAPRGRILDRHGRVIVDNRTSLVVTVNPKDLAASGRRDDVLLRLASALTDNGTPTKVSTLERRLNDRQYSQLQPIPVAIDIPQAAGSETIVWLVSVANTERQEIDREIREWIPADWYTYREWPQHQFTVRHGSVITHVSADNPETLKRGRGDWILLNEGAKMPRLCLDNSIGATADRGGMVCIATNPPTRQKGAWIRDVIEQEKEASAKGERYPIRVLKLDHRGNAAIDRKARSRAGEVMRLLDAKLAAADDEGQVLAIGDLIFHEYDRVRLKSSAPSSDAATTRPG